MTSVLWVASRPSPHPPGKNRPQPDRPTTHHRPHNDSARAPPKPKVDLHAAIRRDARTYMSPRTVMPKHGSASDRPRTTNTGPGPDVRNSEIPRNSPRPSSCCARCNTSARPQQTRPARSTWAPSTAEPGDWSPPPIPGRLPRASRRHRGRRHRPHPPPQDRHPPVDGSHRRRTLDRGPSHSGRDTATLAMIEAENAWTPLPALDHEAYLCRRSRNSALSGIL